MYSTTAQPVPQTATKSDDPEKAGDKAGEMKRPIIKGFMSALHRKPFEAGSDRTDLRDKLGN